MIRSLRIFSDLVETQNFTETGRRNYLTQSAVSQHLKALEEKLKHRLIERGRRQVSLTPAGRLVYAAAREILWRYQRLERMLEHPPREVAGPLRIAATLTVGLYELPPYLSDFLRRYPKVDLQLTYLAALEAYDAIIKNRADVGLVDFPEPHPQLAIHLVKKDRLVVVVPPGHPWSSRIRISLKRLSGQPFIAMQGGSPMRRAVNQMLERWKVQVRIVHEFDNLELIKRAVEVESGLSIVPRKAVLGEVQAKTLKSLEIAEGPFEHPVGILTRKHAERPLAAQKLITALLTPQRRRLR